MRRVPVLLAVVLLFSLGACSDEKPAPAQADHGDTDAIRAGLSSVFAGDHPEARDTENGDCFAEELTRLLSNEQLRDAGILDASYDVVSSIPQLPEEVAEAWADAQITCTDFFEESARAQMKVTKGRIDTDAYAACLREALTEEQMRAGIVDALTGDWQGVDLAALGRAQTDCAAEATPADPA